MQPNSPEIEQIIRAVLQRLAVADDLGAGIGQMVDTLADDTELIVQERLVTLNTLEQRLAGRRRVRVHARAVVTPAVNDLLRSKKIELVRDEFRAGKSDISWRVLPPTSSRRTEPASPKASRVAPVLVCGSAIWFNSLSRHLCPKQATVSECDDNAATNLISQHLSSGGRRAVWLSHKAFAASVTAAKSGCCTAVLLPSLRELKEALAQANPQLMIIDSSHWTVAAVGNLVRSLAKQPAASGK